MLILKFLDLSLVFRHKLVVVFLGLQFLLHGVDYLFERVELPLEERVYVLALFGCARLLEEGGEVLVEVDGAALAVPVGQHVVVAKEHHQLHLLFGAPVLMLENRLFLELSLSIPPLVSLVYIPFFLGLGVVLRSY
jgi:hypothetical protein